MITIPLSREYRPYCTVSRLSLPSGKTLRTMERPWLNNRANVSCIPAGLYKCEHIKRSASGKYRDTWHVTGVPDRSGILIHTGNLASHSRGCILLGVVAGRIGRYDAVLSSLQALNVMRREIGPNDFLLAIT